MKIYLFLQPFLNVRLSDYEHAWWTEGGWVSSASPATRVSPTRPICTSTKKIVPSLMSMKTKTTLPRWSRTSTLTSTTQRKMELLVKIATSLSPIQGCFKHTRQGINAKEAPPLLLPSPKGTNLWTLPHLTVNPATGHFLQERSLKTMSSLISKGLLGPSHAKSAKNVSWQKDC